MGSSVELYHRTVGFDAVLGGGTLNRLKAPALQDPLTKSAITSGRRFGGPWRQTGTKVHAQERQALVLPGSDARKWG